MKLRAMQGWLPLLGALVLSVSYLPAAQAQEASDGEQDPHREKARDGRARAIQKINAEVEHAGAANRRIRAEA